MLPTSVNMRMVREQGLWNVGHLVWAGQRGAVPVNVNGRLWAGWPTYNDSYAGLVRQIRLDASRGLTLEQFIYKYAPPTENRTSSYLSFVSQRTGISPQARLADAVQEAGVEYASVQLPLDDGSGDSSLAGADWNPGAIAAVVLGAAVVAAAVSD